jgi:hypothetical protein
MKKRSATSAPGAILTINFGRLFTLCFGSGQVSDLFGGWVTINRIPLQKVVALPLPYWVIWCGILGRTIQVLRKYYADTCNNP